MDCLKPHISKRNIGVGVVSRAFRLEDSLKLFLPWPPFLLLQMKIPDERPSVRRFGINLQRFFKPIGSVENLTFVAVHTAQTQICINVLWIISYSPIQYGPIIHNEHMFCNCTICNITTIKKCRLCSMYIAMRVTARTSFHKARFANKCLIPHWVSKCNRNNYPNTCLI